MVLYKRYLVDVLNRLTLKHRRRGKKIRKILVQHRLLSSVSINNVIGRL